MEKKLRDILSYEIFRYKRVNLILIFHFHFLTYLFIEVIDVI